MFKWKHWYVRCREAEKAYPTGIYCTWYTQFFPPDQNRSMDMEEELKRVRCPDCKSEVKVEWKG